MLRGARFRLRFMIGAGGALCVENLEQDGGASTFAPSAQNIGAALLEVRRVPVRRLPVACAICAASNEACASSELNCTAWPCTDPSNARIQDGAGTLMTIAMPRGIANHTGTYRHVRKRN